MTQNTSAAVMARRAEPHDSLDYFPTPPWATRALCEWLLAQGLIEHGLGTVWEPAAGEGHMARPLAEYFAEVWASDVHDYGVGLPTCDFLIANTGPRCPTRPDWVITNPPFRLAQAFIERAGRVALDGFAMLVRTSFIEGVERFNAIYRVNPPAYVLQFSERVPMHKGRLTATGSTATAYCWLVWLDASKWTGLGWIPPCRRRLERDGDYPREVAS
ncbi:methyltransferase [Amaricoccus solimangrovi]|uniref:Methyltransferase n=1 Tax=Amaricoccus solimangrovi TaxID=2589815 RepID=A0A501WBD4_9RHOB|nr:methyltransferase [Amaricoccus solimangrovi]TPE47243.1 methyltransferase [Amaricoccus solimangrovi]